MKRFLLKILETIIAFLARLTIRRFSPLVIAVTGSAGKTSAKEAIAAVLDDFFRVRKSSANFNNELGVPLAILGNYRQITKPTALFWVKVFGNALWRLIFGRVVFYPQVLVLEYGADKPGDITRLCQIAQPRIAVVSAIGKTPVHVENYSGGAEAVAREKGNILSFLSASSLAVINGDDPWAENLKKRTRARIRSFGVAPSCDMKISQPRHIQEEGKIEGISFKLESGGSTVPVKILSVFSFSHAYAAAIAACVAQELEVNLVIVSEKLESRYAPISGRSVIFSGVKNSQIIDESYNSSPIALQAALEALSCLTKKRKIAVLGDMMELGSFTIAAHEEAGKQAARSCDILFVVGERAHILGESALSSGMKKSAVHFFSTASEAALELQATLLPGDVVLVKGSRVIGLDKVVEEIANKS